MQNRGDVIWFYVDMEGYQIRILVPVLFNALESFICVSRAGETFITIDSLGVCKNSPVRVFGTGISSAKVVSQKSSLYMNGSNCEMKWNSKPGTRTLLIVSFAQNGSCADQLDVSPSLSSEANTFCGANSTNGTDYVVDFQGDLTMLYTTKIGRPYGGWEFTAILTPFTESSGGKCSESEFLCDDNRCIASSLVCNGDRNCIDRTDENNATCVSTNQNFKVKSSGSDVTENTAVLMVIIMTIVSVATAVITAVVFKLKRKRPRSTHYETSEEDV